MMAGKRLATFAMLALSAAMAAAQREAMASLAFMDGVWHEVGDRIVQGSEPARFFEMHLTRVSDTTWPAGDPINPN